MNSIRFKLVSGFLIFIFVLVGLLMFINQYAIRVVRTQVAESYKSMSDLYVSQLDTSLNDIDKYINIMIEYTDSLSYMNMNISEWDYTIAKIGLSNKLKEDIAIYKIANCFFVYSSAKNDFLNIYNYNEPYTERQDIQSYIANLVSGNEEKGGWAVHKIKNQYYLLHLWNSGNLYFGVWIKASNLMAPMKLIGLGEDTHAIFTTDNGIIMTNTEGISAKKIEQKQYQWYENNSGDISRYLVVTGKSQKSNFRLNILVPDSRILEKLPYMQKIVTVILFITAIIIPAGLYLIGNVVLTPLRKLITAMKKVKNGDLDVRIAAYRTSDEFEVVNQTFNSMVKEIQTLRIGIYEEQITTQKEELHRLRLQLNPHFFMNSLNILYNLSKAQNFELIQEMTLCLIGYFRFIFRNNMNFVHLKDEITHNENYLHIQKLRFPNNLVYEIYSPQFLSDILVPPLIIQTFVENSIKYAVSMDELIRISVETEFLDIDSEQFIQISIRDNGKGFPKELLSVLNSVNKPETDMEHTGVWNVKRRLHLLYKEKASINFQNKEGAVVNIILPLLKE